MNNHEINTDLSPLSTERIEAVPHFDTVDGLRVGFSFMEGWIKLHRKVRENWIWKDPVKFQWWIDILLDVNHTETKIPIGFELVTCSAGQSVRSLQGWAQRWGVGKDTARNFLKMLEKDGMILHENLKKTTRITVCNYEYYQTQLHDKPLHSKRKANAKQTQTGTNKNDKNEKKGYDPLTDGGWIKDKVVYDYLCKFFPKLFKMKNPLSYQGHINLVEKFGKEAVKDIYASMQNYAPLLKNNEDAYLTAIKWLKKDATK